MFTDAENDGIRRIEEEYVEYDMGSGETVTLNNYIQNALVAELRVFAFRSYGRYVLRSVEEDVVLLEDPHNVFTTNSANSVAVYFDGSSNVFKLTNNLSTAQVSIMETSFY